MSIQNNTEYNVYCFDCGQVFSPLPGSPLWWQAKQRADRGFLDALCVNGKECGCDTVKPIDRPDAPFRVFGYDMLLEDFDIPFYRLSEAIDEFRRRNRGPDVVLISGVSQAVQDRLHHISR